MSKFNVGLFALCETYGNVTEPSRVGVLDSREFNLLTYATRFSKNAKNELKIKERCRHCLSG